MARYINTDDIKYTDMLAPMGNGNYEHVGIVTESEIDALPTVDAAPVRHGKWIDEGQYNDFLPFHTWRCSTCGGPVSKERVPWFKYCPHCGARMDSYETES